MIANRLNTFFTNIGPKLASQFVTDGNSSYEDLLINPTVREFSFDEIREQDVVNVIDKLPSKTSSGVDGISTNLLKDIKYLISKPLTLIINIMSRNWNISIQIKNSKINTDIITIFASFHVLGMRRSVVHFGYSLASCFAVVSSPAFSISMLT